MAKHKNAILRNRRRVRYHKRSDGSSDSENMSTEIKEIFDQIDLIYKELELNSNEAFQSNDLSELDASLDFVYEQIGKWLVSYCGCLVQKEQVGTIDVNCLENLLDSLLGIIYQLEAWHELVQSLIQDLRTAFKDENEMGVPLKDLDELERRQKRVQEVQNYLSKIKERHSEHLLTNDNRSYSQLTSQEQDTLALRYSRFMVASFPSTTPEHLHDILKKLSIDQLPCLLKAY